MSKERKVKMEIALSEELLESVLITAFDGNLGGCWYWAAPQTGSWLSVKHAAPCPRVVDSLSVCSCTPAWTSVSIRDREDPDETWTVTYDTIADGIAHLLEHDSIRSDLMEQIRESVATGDPDIDADAADCIVQAGLFGKIVYS